MRVELTIPGEPVAQPRTRSTKGGHHYTPDNGVNGFKECIRIKFAEAYQGAPSEKPVMVQMTAVFARPKYMRHKTKPMPRVPHTSRKDVDNVLKAALDALNKVAWIDDAQVYYAIVQKFIASGDEQPHTRIVISD